MKCSDSKSVNFAVFFSSAYLEKVLWRDLDEKSWNPFQARGCKEPDVSQDWHRNGAALAQRQWTNRFSAPKTTASGKKRQVQLSDVSVSLSKQRLNAERWECCPRIGTESPYGQKDKTGQGRNYGGMGLMTAVWGQRDVAVNILYSSSASKTFLSLILSMQEEQNRGKPNWEHLNEDLHVLITVEDAQNRAEIKLKRAVEEVNKLLVPAAEGEDSLKKMQLMELAILNGTYRDANIKSPSAQAPRIITGPAPVLPPTALRTPTPAGPTIMPLIRQIQTVMPNGTGHPATATLVQPGPESGLIYATPYEYPYTLAPATSILEYPIDSSGVLASSKAEELPLYLGFQTCHIPITVQRGEPTGRPPF
ncbi:KH domain-containing RNA-binding protein QKI-like [Garra rufa]|uniref:KH domain-containing RNA-binding protein QKI-like n=1 Tax=Garra rufa TaxID=137080 RepID=UPI003CCECA13